MTMDRRLKEQVNHAILKGITSVPEIRGLLDLYVSNTLYVSKGIM